MAVVIIVAGMRALGAFPNAAIPDTNDKEKRRMNGMTFTS